MRLVRCSWMTGILLSLAVSGCTRQPARPDAARADRTVELQILAINDFHGNLEPPEDDLGGAAYLAAHLRRAESSAPHTIIVSAGDLVGASPLISSLFYDEPTVKAANLFGLDVNAAGNHEFDEGWRELLRMQRGGAREGGDEDFAGADFDILSANVIVEATGETLLPPYTIKRFDGIPVAFIGLPLQGTPTVVVASGVAGLAFKDEVATINTLVHEIRQQDVEAIVVVIHQGGYPAGGTEDDCRDFTGPIIDIVARTDPAVDLFVTGHTHRHYLCSLGGRPVTSAGSMGRYYTDIEARLDRASGDMTITGVDNVPVTHDIEPAADVAALVDEYRGRVEEIAQTVVGTVTADVTEKPNERGGSQLGALIADAQLAATQDEGADVAFMNAGGIRTDLLYAAGDGENDGEVTFAEISATQPFGNTLMTITLTGAQLDTLLEQQWAGQPSPDILMPSKGFSYTWSRSAPEGEKVDPGSIRIEGEAVRAEGRYRVTVNNFLAAGGDGFPVLAEGTERVESVLDVEALEEYLREHSPIAPQPLERIRVVP
ncbi:MAG TPA: bifunctional metallophosphatase/5'-nucleotidase, partial [Woeseiaceae bacterium]|nr:bifunctional metallophosphatase/5'-nucleotidase [Woeseiaceae bacterium]